MSSNLQQALALRLSDCRSNRADRLKREVCAGSAIAAALLDKVERGGCTIALEAGMKAAGAFFPGKNCIILNEELPDARLMSTLVHEARHFEQMQNAPNCAARSSLELESLIKVCRAREADAKAFQCAAAHQMLDSNPKVWKEFFHASPEIASAYADKFRETGSAEASLPEAFKAWYDDLDYADKYDRKMLTFMEGQLSKNTANLMKESFSSKALAEQICRFGKACYLKGTDAAFLDTRRAATIKEDIFFRCGEVSKRAFERGLSEKEDFSYIKLCVKGAAGIVGREGKMPRFSEADRRMMPVSAVAERRRYGR